MAKPRKLEDLMALLNQVRSDPTSELGTAGLRQILASKYGVAVVQATELIGKLELRQFIPDLVTAFDRFLIKGVDSDPGCRAKRAIAKALYELNYSDETLFLAGIRCIQLEPVWGGKQDTAPSLRGICALGLVRMNYPLVMVELADLLADAESVARIGAARAIAYSGSDQGVPLLRLRIRVGDTAPVLAECLIALLALAPESSLPLVKEILYSQEEVGSAQEFEQAEVAALALGESRLPEAFAMLQAWWQQISNAELRQSGLLAIATLRQPAAINFLLALVAEGNSRDAKAALKALSIYAQDETLWQRVQQTVEQREDIKLEI